MSSPDQLSQFRNVGIMSLRHHPGDWLMPFGPIFPQSSSIIPSASRIVFFRWENPPDQPTSREANEVRFFEAVHDELLPINGKGLDAVIVFGSDFSRSSRAQFDIAEGVKSVSSKIKVLGFQDTPDDALARGVKRKRVDKIVNLHPSLSYVPSFMRLLKLPPYQDTMRPSNKVMAELYDTLDVYKLTYPRMLDEKGFFKFDSLMGVSPPLPQSPSLSKLLPPRSLPSKLNY